MPRFGAGPAAVLGAPKRAPVGRGHRRDQLFEVGLEPREALGGGQPGLIEIERAVDLDL